MGSPRELVKHPVLLSFRDRGFVARQDLAASEVEPSPMFTGISTVFEVHCSHHLKASIRRLGPFLEHQPISATSRIPRRRHTRMLRLFKRHDVPRWNCQNTLLKQRFTSISGSRVSGDNFSVRHSQKIGPRQCFNSAVGS